MIDKCTERYPVGTPQYYCQAYRGRRERAIRYLGGRCAVCGATENLEFDHMVPVDKGFEINLNMRAGPAKLRAELDKCQLLCKSHHRRKHRSSPLTRDMVGTIKKRLRTGETAVSIAGDFPVAPQAICNIRTGRTWADVA